MESLIELFKVFLKLALQLYAVFAFLYGFINHYYWIVFLILWIVIVWGFPTYKRVIPDLGNKIEARIGMPLEVVLNETTLGVHLLNCEPTSTYNVYQGNIIHYYYLDWGHVRFENYVLTDIVYK